MARLPAQLAGWWHLLSLDAPTVATLWAWSFAHAFHLSLSASSLLLLFSGTWLIYVADRILDGLHQDSARLRERHLFYIRHRFTAIAAAIPVSLVLLWLVFFRMLPATRRADTLIFTVAAAYFALVHLFGRAIERWFPKELIVAIVAAAAIAAPAFSRLTPAAAQHPAQDKALIALMSLFFTAICWLNCVAIEKWERPRVHALRVIPRHDPPQISDRTSRWGQRRLRAISIVFAAASLITALVLLPSNSSVAELCFAAAISAALFVPLDRSSSGKSPVSAFHLRIAADAALLTPLLLLIPR